MQISKRVFIFWVKFLIFISLLIYVMKDNTINDQLNNITKKKKYKAKLSEKGITIDFSREDIEKNLPNLARELNNPKEDSIFSINEYRKKDELSTIKNELSVKDIDDLSENLLKKKIPNIKSIYDEDSELYYPKTEDFIRRCSNLEEAEKIIDFQLKMKEITEKEAKELKSICQTKGIEYFGPKKKKGYYERTYRK